MKRVFYNETTAKEEKENLKRAKDEDDKRKDYLESLTKNKHFQRYVLDEIIREEIRMNENISGDLVNLVGAEPDTVKSIIVAKSGGLASARNILNKIVN